MPRAKWRCPTSFSSQAGFRLGANVDGEKTSTTYIDDLFFLKDALTKEEVLEIMAERK